MPTVHEQQSNASAPSNIRPAQNRKPPYQLYAGILLGFALVRVLDLATQRMHWTVLVHDSIICRLCLPLAAMLGAYLAATKLRATVSWLVVVPLCGLIGAVATMLTNTAVGVFIGLATGGFICSLRPERVAALGRFIIAMVKTTLIPAVASGLIAGALLLLSYSRFAAPSAQAERVSLAIPFVLSFVAFVFWMRFSNPSRRWWSWIGSVCLFLAFLPVGFLAAMGTESYRLVKTGVERGSLVNAIDAISPDLASNLSFWNWIQPIDRTVPPLHASALYFDENSSREAIESAKLLPFPISIEVLGSNVTDHDIAGMHLRYLRSFRCMDNTSLTDRSILSLDASRLESLTLGGSNFTDAGLETIASAQNLTELCLTGSEVTTAGLAKHVDPQAPLNFLTLDQTSVGDEIFQFCARYPTLRFLDLSGTNVTGEGLQHLRTTGVISLSLANSKFDPRHLKSLLPTKSEPLPFPASLNLLGIPLTDDDIATIVQLKPTSLFISHAKLSDESMALLSTLQLNYLRIRADQFSRNRLKGFPKAMTLSLHYEAEELSLDEILTDFRSLQRDWREIHPTPPGTAGSGIQLFIANLSIDDSVLAKLSKCAAETPYGDYGIFCIDARMPNGEKSTASLGWLKVRYKQAK